MVDTEELAQCFDADQLRGYSPIRNFTREERRVIAYALRQVRAPDEKGMIVTAGAGCPPPACAACGKLPQKHCQNPACAFRGSDLARF